MLDSNITQQLDQYLAHLKNEVHLVVSLDDSKAAQEILTLANEIAALSPLIKVSRDDNASSRKPVMAVVDQAKNTAITFAGLPMGHEFTSLVLALLHTGGHPMKLDDATISQIKALDKKCDVEVFISLSCQNCPDVVQAFNMLSALNPLIRTTMIDGALFQDEVKQRDILAVPSVFINGELFGQGRMSLPEILSKLDSQAAQKMAASLNDKAPYDVLVVGGGPAGVAAAVYAARKGIRTGVVAQRIGGQVLDTMAIENFISVKHTEGPRLASDLHAHLKEYGVDIIADQQVQSLKGLEKNSDGKIHVALQSGATLSSEAVILAPGARWREMGVPGEQQYRNKGVAFCPHCDGPLFKGQKIAVIGGGNSGIEAAIDLAGIASFVTVLEFADTLRADKVLINKANSLPNVKIITMAKTLAVLGDGKRVTGLDYKDLRTDKVEHLELSGIFVQIGLVPNTEWLKDSHIALTPRGEIEIGLHGETNLAGVFAAGDATTVPYKQIIIAMGEGAKASLGAFDYLIRKQR
ncbi:MAG: alkyl hydroperoxide reductase subunit F [Vibrionaceae bacterium]